VLDGLRAKEVLILDAGNALFRAAGLADDEARSRARFVLGAMGRLGTRVMNVGARDLSAGVDFLQDAAKGANVQLISANLMRSGSPAFPPSAVVDVNGTRVGLVGLIAPGPVPGCPESQGAPLVETARRAISALGRRDLTVLLAAASYADVLQLALALKGKVDFVIQSGEFRGTVPPQAVDGTQTYVLASGQRGQSVSKLTLVLQAGRRGFVDLTEAERDLERAKFLKSQIETLEQRLRAVQGKSDQSELKLTLADLKRRLKVVEASASAPISKSSSTMHNEWILLGPAIADEPSMKAEVLRVEPSYSGLH
jgi:2',3'-cyclic-nucleotide 2'-phosphodiesterase (5'-nucleotidase family)